MGTTTIRVSSDLHDRLVRRAARTETTLAGAIVAALDVEEREAFWSEVRATMSTPDAQRHLAEVSESYASTLLDGLDPEEDWSDLE